MDKQNKSEPKKKGSASRGSDPRKRVSQPRQVDFRGPSAPVQTSYGYSPTSQPPFYYPQPSPPQFYSTQPLIPPQIFSHPTFTTDFDAFAFRTPPIQSPRENVERPLPIYDDDQDEEIVPETQHLDVDSGEDEEEYEDEDDDIGEGSDTKQKGVKAERQSWTKNQEEALAKAWVHCSLNKKKSNQQKLDSFWKKSSRPLQRNGRRKYSNSSSSTFKMDAYVD
ncbi:hypothetical protein HanRHA438_Chr05g0232841 [Helianthus annuus]|nr:hypothetical protein HanHA89_Chr05g0197911 [Helianthus annuus]KAJ0919718.1 hypothetical protein HanRHA438_Chr05g0232841 [Helianthus annuus]